MVRSSAHRLHLRLTPVLAAIVAATLAAPAAARQDNPVFVDDSPVAWELFRRAQDQVSENVGEAVRQLQELLDEDPLKLVPVTSAASDHLTSVRRRVIDMLRSDQTLLERYRVIHHAEARRLLEDGRLERLVLTRPLTEPGLEAMLRLAQVDLEDGRFNATRRWLALALDHPDLGGRRAGHAWFMWGVASHHLGALPDVEAALAALSDLGAQATALHERLQQIVGLEPVVRQDRGVTPLDRTDAVDLVELVGEDIWSVPLKDTLFSRRAADVASDRSSFNRALEQNRAEGFLLTSAPTVAGDVVYVNQGHRVTALDRFSGLPVWPRDYLERPSVAVIDRDDEQVRDMNLVAVAQNALVTITGHAYGTTRSSDGKVVCLDPATGGVRWELPFDRFRNDDELAGLFPHSAPVISEGSVYILARKVSPQALSSCYVIAIDLTSGSVRWIRHIVSTGAIRRAARSFSTLSIEQGDIYIASPVGAIARIEPAMGEIQWLLRFSVPLNPSPQEQARRPWELASHIVTDRHVIALQPGMRRIVVADRATGTLEASYEATDRGRWNSPSYLLANDRMLFAVGREIHAFDLNDLDQALWKLPDYEQSVADGGEPATIAGTRLEIRGRVQLVHDAMIVPTDDTVVIVASDSGRVLHRMAVPAPGQPLAVDSQLILVGHDRVDAYMSLPRAQEMLRERIASSPDNPEPALSLTRLAVRVADLDLVLEGARATTNAIRLNRSQERSQDAQERLFDMMLGAEIGELVDRPDDGERFFAEVGSIVASGPQRVAYLLAYGDWLRHHAAVRAIEAYQSVLSDPVLARLPWIEDDVLRPAASCARDRIARVLRERGREVYAAQADFAALKLRQLHDRRPTAPADLFAIAGEFPFAPAAVDAAVRGAERAAQSGDLSSALAGLVAAIRAVDTDLPDTHTGAARRALVEAYARLSLRNNLPGQAANALQLLLRTDGNVELQLTDAPADETAPPNGPGPTRTVRAWLSSLGVTLSRPQPTVGDPAGEAQVFDGAIVPFHRLVAADAPPERPRDAVVISRGGNLVLLSSSPLEGLTERWSVPTQGESPRLLLHENERLLIWNEAEENDTRAMMLNPRDGTTRWATPSLHDHISVPAPELRRQASLRNVMQNGRPFDPNAVIPLVNRERLVMVMPTGGIAAFALGDGSHPAWVKQQSLDQVHHAILHEDRLILAGLHRRNADGGRFVLTSMLMVIDAATGRVMHGGPFEAPQSGGGLIWLLGGPLGSVVYASEDGLGAIDVHTGELIWATVSYAALNPLRGWIFGGRLLVEDRDGGLRSARLRDGRLSTIFETPERDQWEPLELLDVREVDGGELLARFRRRLVRYDGNGRMVGVDVIRDDRAYLWSLPSRDRLVLVSAMQAMPHDAEDQFGGRFQHIYRIYQLSSNCRVLGEPLQVPPLTEPLREAAIVDGWLLLSTSGSTLAVPMPATGESAPRL